MSPAKRKKRKAPRKKAARKKVAKRVVRKQAPARKQVTRKKAVKRVVRKKAPVRKKVARKKAVKRVVPKQVARKKVPARKPAAKRPAPAPAFPQRANASPKQLLLFELIRARASLLSAVQGLAPGATSEPIAEGKWTPREIVLHVVTRDQARLRELESTLHGNPPSWKGAREEDWAAINENNLTPLRHHDWDEALRLLHRTRQELIEEIESVPEEPSERWGSDHPFGAMMNVLPTHDRHHADQIKRWRGSRGA